MSDGIECYDGDATLPPEMEALIKERDALRDQVERMKSHLKAQGDQINNLHARVHAARVDVRARQILEAKDAIGAAEQAGEDLRTVCRKIGQMVGRIISTDGDGETHSIAQGIRESAQRSRLAELTDSILERPGAYSHGTAEFRPSGTSSVNLKGDNTVYIRDA